MMRSTIARIEAAKHRPTLETMEKIVKALKMSAADLIAPRDHQRAR
jgi:transcriptional regulator with XRE-family HTH domain